MSVFYRLFLKRFLDIVFSGISLIVFAPLILFLMFLISINLGSPVMFKQRRPGKNGKIFTLHKFRTMTGEKDENGILLPDEMRLTKFGKFLRTASMDELPELWDIFRGKMSVVGPRPQLIKDLVFMDDEIKKRHNARPGLTGLAQISGRNNLTWDERFAYDLQYVKKITFLKDTAIFFRTFAKVFKRSDIATDGMATSMDYGDWLLSEGRISEEEYYVKMILNNDKEKDKIC